MRQKFLSFTPIADQKVLGLESGERQGEKQGKDAGRSTSTLLARWAIVGSALPNYDLQDHGIATVATLAFPSIDVQLFLESSHRTVAIHKIANGRAPGNNSFSEYIWNSFENANLLIFPEVANSATRIDASLK